MKEPCFLASTPFRRPPTHTLRSRARGIPFAAAEHRGARAWAVYWIAYGAWISTRPGERDWPDDSWPALLVGVRRGAARLTVGATMTRVAEARRFGMIDLRSHHIPDGYAPVEMGLATVWMSPAEWDDPVAASVPSLVEDALESVTSLLAFRPRRAVHAVIYASTDDAHAALDRRVPSSFLMAPLHTPEVAVIVAHSPRLDPRNGNRERMLRLLCHEVTHVVAAERTGSTKRLGDGNAGMRVRPWVDEGFAVCVAARAAGQPEALARALGRDDPMALSMDEIDRELCALDSPRRSQAFAAATARVWAAVQRHGLVFVFDHLDRPERWG